MAGKFEEEVWRYVYSVLDGSKPACKELKQTCQRFLDDYNSGRWDYDTAEADYVIEKVQTQFVHRQGEDLEGQPMKGKPLLYEPWEKFIVYGILAFCRSLLTTINAFNPFSLMYERNSSIL